MRQRQPSNGLFYAAVGIIAVATVLSCLAFAHQEQLLVRYYAWIDANPAQPAGDAHHWLVARPRLSVPFYLDVLREDHPDRCARAGSRVREILRFHHDPAIPEHAELAMSLASMLTREFSAYSTDGKIQAIGLAMDLLEQQLDRWSPNVATSINTAGQVIRVALRDPSYRVQEAALSELPRAWGWDGYDQVVEAVVDEWKKRCNKEAVALMSSDSAGVRAAAARALNGAIERSGDTRLAELLTDPEPLVQKAALETIFQSAGDILGPSHRRQLFEMADSVDGDVARMAHELLVRDLGEHPVHVLTLMRNPDPDQRAQAAQESLQLTDRSQQSIVLNELAKDSSAQVRLAAVLAAQKVDHPQMTDLVKQLSADDPDDQVRKACLMALDRPTATNKK